MTLRTDLISSTSASDHADQHNGANTRILDVRDYGADPTGSTGDLSTAIADAQADLAANGGTIRVPPGDYRLATTLEYGNGTSSSLSSWSGVSILGEGAPANYIGSGGIGGGGNDWGAVRVHWDGSVGGTMVSINGPLAGFDFRNFFLDGEGSAAVLMHNISGQFGRLQNIQFSGYTGYGYKSETVPSFSGNVPNSMHNRMDSLWFNGGDIDGAVNVYCGGNGSDFSSNTCYDTWTNTYMTATPSSGHTMYQLVLRECDNIRFYNLHFAIGGVGTTVDVVFDYRGNPGWPCDCSITDVDFGSTNAVIVNAGSPSGATINRIVGISSGNGRPSDPALSNLAWGYTAANP